jgi:putative endopeptidase
MRRGLAATAILLAISCPISSARSAPDDGLAPDTPLEALPHPPVIDVSALDRSVDPCVDFFQYACGNWIKRNPIPADRSSWSAYGKLAADGERFLWGILQTLGEAKGALSPSQQKIGDYFAACMDEARVAALGAAPVRPYLLRIDALRSKQDLGALLGSLERDTAAGLFFDFTSDQDASNSQSMIGVVSAGGLSLPDRDYYLRRDKRSIELRAKYLAHVEHVLRLADLGPEDAHRQAAAILAIETRLASATLRAGDTRDPYRLVHKMDETGLRRLAPSFDWTAYMGALGVDAHGTVNVTEPRFLHEFERLLRERPLAELAAYLRWHILSSASPRLSPDFVEADFQFYAHTLRGVPKMAPRWRVCVNLVDTQLGDALGEEFVARTFGPDTKQRVARMASEIEAAMQGDLEQIAWMSAATRAEALAKLRSITNKIGYPERWRNYDAVRISRSDFFGNTVEATRFETQRQLAKIGQPVDHSEWDMSAPTVNADYREQMNDINFPAGILQPPLFDPKADDAANFGGTGGTIGHELTHGFDDEGRKYDSRGNLRDWWSRHDAREFEQRAQCVVDQFDHYTVLDGLKVNGKLTAGENIADLGGLVLAWMAWRQNGTDLGSAPIEGLTPAQRFFVAYGQSSCAAERDEQTRIQVQTDPHSPDQFRVNGPLSNLPEFATAFVCHRGQAMVSARPCRIW